MDKPTQLTFQIEQRREELALPPEARVEVLDGMAKLLLQVLSLEEEKEDEDDL